jgi:hypothetical protein
MVTSICVLHWALLELLFSRRSQVRFPVEADGKKISTTRINIFFISTKHEIKGNTVQLLQNSNQGIDPSKWTRLRTVCCYSASLSPSSSFQLSAKKLSRWLFSRVLASHAGSPGPIPGRDMTSLGPQD